MCESRVNLLYLWINVNNSLFSRSAAPEKSLKRCIVSGFRKNPRFYHPDVFDYVKNERVEFYQNFSRLFERFSVDNRI